MAEDTCIETGCDEPVHIKMRRLCKRHYTSARRRDFDDTRRRVVSPTRHHITTFDSETMTGQCQLCGDVRVVIRHGGPKCYRSERRSSTKNRHGLSFDQIEAMIEAVNGRCPLCDVEFDEQGEVFCIDHDHRCCPGKKGCALCVRGLLCRRCNVAMAMMRDNADIARRAAIYLETNRATPI